jgi:probable phosphoglycerate mutase
VEDCVELLLVRHGLPLQVVGADGPADPALAPEGTRQAVELAAYLADDHIDAIYASPLRRARETAEPLAAALGLQLLIDEDLAEMDRFSNTYVPMEELRRNPELAAQVKVSVDADRETSADFRSRVITVIEKIIDAHAGERVLVVCHGGVINNYFAHVLGLTGDVVLEPRYTSVNRLLASRRGHRNIESLNETHHLGRLGALAPSAQPTSSDRPGDWTIDDLTNDEVSSRDSAASLSKYRYWRPIPTEQRHYSGGHLAAVAADEAMFVSRGSYFADAVAYGGINPLFWLVYRHFEIDYLGEAYDDEPLRCGTRAIRRTNRTIVMRQILQVTGTADGRPCAPRTIATADLVTVAFDVARRCSVPVPDDLWAAVRRYEGGA